MARTFKDEAGREWSIRVDVRALRTVREATGFELAKLLDDNLKRLGELGADPELFCRVLWALADNTKHAVELDTFLVSMAGDSLEAAFNGFLLAYADFCPSQRRALLLSLVTKTQELSTAQTAKAIERIDGLTPETLSGGPGDSPDSSASTPAG